MMPSAVPPSALCLSEKRRVANTALVACISSVALELRCSSWRSLFVGGMAPTQLSCCARDRGRRCCSSLSGLLAGWPPHLALLKQPPKAPIQHLDAPYTPRVTVSASRFYPQQWQGSFCAISTCTSLSRLSSGRGKHRADLVAA
jgi:hypothetical protein